MTDAGIDLHVQSPWGEGRLRAGLLGRFNASNLLAALATLLAIVDPGDDVSTALQSSIRSSFEESSGGHGALAGLAFLVFVLLYTPCMASLAAFRHEFGTRWMFMTVIGQFLVAWLGAFVVFQGGRLLGLG